MDYVFNMSLCLTPEEIQEITQKTRYSAQRRVLRAMGIESKPRPDGSVLVDRAHYNEWVRGKTGKGRRPQDNTDEPRWDAA